MSDFGTRNRALWLRIYRKSARVACCVDCVLRVCCMWVAWQGHATQPSYFQSPASATQKSSMHPKVLHLPHKYHRFFYPICNSDCCHYILHPFSYCQPMSWAYEKVVLAETVTMPFVSVRVLQKNSHPIEQKIFPGFSKKTAMASSF